LEVDFLVLLVLPVLPDCLDALDFLEVLACLDFVVVVFLRVVLVRCVVVAFLDVVFFCCAPTGASNMSDNMIVNSVLI
jgi:hypothetical protein